MIKDAIQIKYSLRYGVDWKNAWIASRLLLPMPCLVYVSVGVNIEGIIQVLRPTFRVAVMELTVLELSSMFELSSLYGSLSSQSGHPVLSYIPSFLGHNRFRSRHRHKSPVIPFHKFCSSILHLQSVENIHHTL